MVVEGKEVSHNSYGYMYIPQTLPDQAFPQVMLEVLVIGQEVLILPCVGQQFTPGHELQIEEFVVTQKTTKQDLQT